MEIAGLPQETKECGACSAIMKAAGVDMFTRWNQAKEFIDRNSGLSAVTRQRLLSQARQRGAQHSTAAQPRTCRQLHTHTRVRGAARERAGTLSHLIPNASAARRRCPILHKSQLCRRHDSVERNERNLKVFSSLCGCVEPQRCPLMHTDPALPLLARRSARCTRRA